MRVYDLNNWFCYTINKMENGLYVHTFFIKHSDGYYKVPVGHITSSKAHEEPKFLNLGCRIRSVVDGAPFEICLITDTTTVVKKMGDNYIISSDWENDIVIGSGISPRTYNVSVPKLGISYELDK